MDRKKVNQGFLLLLIACSVSTVLSVLSAHYDITLIPTINVLGTQGLYIIIWIPSLIALGIYIYDLVRRKRSVLSLLPPIVILGGCVYQLSFLFAKPQSVICYSTSREGLKVEYKCICKTKYLESPYEYTHEDCQFAGVAFSPLAQKLTLPGKRYGQILIGGNGQADFTRNDWLGKPFDSEYPSKLSIEKSGYIQLGYMNFEFVKKTNTFNISLIVDLECSKYYTDSISIKNGEDVLIKLCGKEYRLIFIYDNDFIITLLT